jgi:hypothetical protein
VKWRVLFRDNAKGLHYVFCVVLSILAKLYFVYAFKLLTEKINSRRII